MTDCSSSSDSATSLSDHRYHHGLLMVITQYEVLVNHTITFFWLYNCVVFELKQRHI